MVVNRVIYIQIRYMIRIGDGSLVEANGLRPVVSINLQERGYTLEKNPDNNSEYILHDIYAE